MLTSLIGAVMLPAVALLGSPAASPAPDAAIDIRGIVKGNVLDAEKAAARGLNPAEIQIPKITRRVKPKYPPGAMERGLTGTVVIDCRIGIDGVPRECKVAKRANGWLDDAALTAVKQCRYSPLTVHGEPRPALMSFALMFNMEFQGEVETESDEE